MILSFIIIITSSISTLIPFKCKKLQEYNENIVTCMQDCLYVLSVLWAVSILHKLCNFVPHKSQSQLIFWVHCLCKQCTYVAFSRKHLTNSSSRGTYIAGSPALLLCQHFLCFQIHVHHCEC